MDAGAAQGTSAKVYDTLGGTNPKHFSAIRVLTEGSVKL
jgi:hypothetical protein